MAAYIVLLACFVSYISLLTGYPYLTSHDHIVPGAKDTANVLLEQ